MAPQRRTEPRSVTATTPGADAPGGTAHATIPPRSPGARLTADARLLGTWPVRRASDLAEIRRSAAEAVGGATAADATLEAETARDTGRLGDPVVRLTLVLSELATNALKFGSGLAVVTVSEVGAGWIVDAHDANLRDYPRPHHPDPQRTGQHGLLLVTALAPTWGWYVDSWTRRKHVWALVRGPSASADSPA